MTSGDHLIQALAQAGQSRTQDAQNNVQAAFYYLQGSRLKNLFGKSVPVLNPSHRKHHCFFFTDVQRELPVFQFVPIVSGPVTRHHWKPLSPFSLCPTCRYLYILKSSPWLLQSLFTAKVLQFPHPFCGPSLSWLSSVAPTSSCTKEPRTEHNPLAHQPFLCFVSYANLLWTWSAPSPGSLMKMLKRTGPDPVLTQGIQC